MKETHRPYSAGVLALKAAILPPLLVIIESCLSIYLTGSPSAENVILIAKALGVFLLEIIFLILVSLVKKAEIWSFIRVKKKDIATLESLKASANSTSLKKIEAKIVKNQEEILAVLGS